MMKLPNNIHIKILTALANTPHNTCSFCKCLPVFFQPYSFDRGDEKTIIVVWGTFTLKNQLKHWIAQLFSVVYKRTAPHTAKSTRGEKDNFSHWAGCFRVYLNRHSIPPMRHYSMQGKIVP